MSQLLWLLVGIGMGYLTWPITDWIIDYLRSKKDDVPEDGVHE